MKTALGLAPPPCWTAPSDCPILVVVLGLTWLLMFHAAVGPAEASATQCSIQIEGVPRPQLSRHKVRWNGTLQTARPNMQLELRESSAVIRLEGPRYGGEQLVRDGDCGESKVFTLRATPLPALIQVFCPPAETVLRCEDCDGAPAERWYLPEQFPPIPMDGPRRTVTLLAKALGHRPLRQRISLYPGRNVVDLDLEAIPAPQATSAQTPCLEGERKLAGQ